MTALKSSDVDNPYLVTVIVDYYGYVHRIHREQCRHIQKRYASGNRSDVDTFWDDDAEEWQEEASHGLSDKWLTCKACRTDTLMPGVARWGETLEEAERRRAEVEAADELHRQRQAEETDRKREERKAELQKTEAERRAGIRLALQHRLEWTALFEEELQIIQEGWA